jgi:aspartate aminotransferase
MVTGRRRVKALAERAQRMGTEAAFRVFAKAKALEAAGRDVVHLELGESDAPTPRRIVQAAERALRAGHTGYAPAAGLPALREAVARRTGEQRGLTFAPEQVVITPGGKAVIFFTYLALVEAGDEVLYPDPGFPIFESLVDALGAVRRPYHPGSGPSRRPDLDAVERLAGPRTKLLVLNSPGNPTGVVHTRAEVERFAAVARRHDLWVLSDEIYARILYAPEHGSSVEPGAGGHVSIATLPGMAERTILLDGFSKTWAMTGWRLGWAALPPPLAPIFERLMSNSASCATSFAQHGALAAFEGGREADAELAAMVTSLRERRDLLVAGLNRLPGLACDLPGGSFFAFPDVRETGVLAPVLAERLLEEAGVACVEGGAFGRGGTGHLRLSFGAPRARLEEALARLARFFG